MVYIPIGFYKKYNDGVPTPLRSILNHFNINLINDDCSNSQ